MTIPSAISEDWAALVGEVLERPADSVATAAAVCSFTELGGTSLQAVRLGALGAERLRQRPSMGDLLGGLPLTEALARAAPAAGPEGPARPPAALGRALPQQEAILDDDQRLGGGAYHLLFTAEVWGAMDEDRLEAAVARLAERHEGLRTVFSPGADGWRTRVVRGWRPVLWRRTLRPAPGQDAAAAVEEQLRAGGGQLLDPERRPPVSFHLFTLDGAPPGGPNAVLAILGHHAILDGWAYGQIWRELVACYAGPPPGPAATAGAALAALDELREAGELARLAERRAAELEGVPPVLELPGDLHRPAVQDPSGTRLPFGLSPAAARGCERLRQACGVTRTAVLLAAWALVLARRTGADDLVVGVPAMARTRPELMEVLANLVQLVPVRCRLDDDGSIARYVRGVAAALAEAVAAQDVPLRELLSRLAVPADRGRAPLAQFGLGAHDELVPARVRGGGLELALREGHCGGTPFDACLFVQRWDPEPQLTLEYATAVLTPAEAADLADSFGAALAELARDPERPLHTVRTISARQRAALARTRRGPERALDTDAWHLVAGAAARWPDEMAVRDPGGDRELTYRALLHAVERQAAALARAGVVAGDTVIVSLPRSAGEVVAVLAALRCGAAYACVDADLPDARLRAMLATTRPRAVLAEAERARRIAGLAGPGCAIVPPAPLDGPAPAGVPAAAPPDPERIAYLTFTSGSTGVPKAVRVPHRGVVRLVRDPDYMRAGPGDRMPRFGAPTFDAFTLEVFAPLANGGTIEVLPDGVPSSAELGRFIRERGVTVLWITAGLFRVMVEHEPEAFAQVRQVLTGGDVVPADAVRSLLERFPGLRVTNGYGPSECAVFTTVCHFDDPASVVPDLPIGRAIAGTGILVLDRHGREVPPGAIGELSVTGPALAVDYLGDERATAAAFGRPAPDTGERAYRTGDLVRLDGEGRLRFLGRGDGQVKVRGFRIELQEVQRHLVAHPAVRDGVVVAAGADAATRRLVAGVVADDRPGLLGELRDHLAARLPAYEVPSLWALVERIPLTANGKVDAAQLERIATDAPSGAPDAAGAVEGADVVREAWRAVLGGELPPPSADLATAGCDSLGLVRLVAWLRAQRGVEISVRDVHRDPTVAGLTAIVRAAGPARRRPAATIPRRPFSSRLPVTLAQESHLRRERWREERGLPDRALNVDVAYRLRGPLDEAALLGALRDLVRRHDALRVRFEAAGDGHAQVIQSEVHVEIEELVPDPAPDPMDGVRALLYRRSRVHSDRWAEGPRLHAGLARLGPDDHVLQLTVDHLLCDGWSAGVLLRELSRRYAGRALPDPGLGYGDWVRWTCERLGSPEAERDRAHWLDRLAGISPRPPVEFPFRPRGRRLPGLAGVMTVAPMPAGLAEPAAYGSGLTPFVLFSAAAQLMLHATTGQPAVGVITPVANRGREETHGLVGWLSNTVVLRLDVRDGDRVRDAVERSRTGLEGAIAHGEHTIHDLIRRLTPEAFGRIRDTASAYVSTHLDPVAPFALDGLDAEPVRVDDPFSLHGIQFGLRPASGGGLEAAILCESGWLTEAELEGLGADLRRVAEAVIGEPDRTVADLRRALTLVHPRFRA
jgi:amino acid adenylation domain-containing protein